MEEVEHKISVLEGAKQALLEKDSFLLKQVSNQTVHSASLQQDAGSLIIATLVYALSKLVERKDYVKIRNWDKLVEKINSNFTSAIKAAMESDEEKFNLFLQKARESLEESSVDMKQYIQDVLRKASVNKASRIYEHGISLGQTAQILGLTNWELAEYAGQSKWTDAKYLQTLDEKSRAKMALEFFS